MLWRCGWWWRVPNVISSTFFPSMNNNLKPKENPLNSHINYYILSFNIDWLRENIILWRLWRMWRICHKQLLMVKIYSVGMISNMSGVKYEKLFPKYLHILHILHTYDFWEKFFWKSNSNGERKHPQMMISRFLHTFYFLLIKWLLIEEDNHPQHPPSSTRINIPHENLVIPPPPIFGVVESGWRCGFSCVWMWLWV